MELYDETSYEASKVFTTAYSTSFSMSIRLFDTDIRKHIYAIYGLVRIADEIVDTYQGKDKQTYLDALEVETLHALKTGYSTNPIVHAFALTAILYNIKKDLIAPFFESMRLDLTKHLFDQKLYETYIFGSAEVVGLMCLKVFTGDTASYDSLQNCAKKLGAAYQKINFLRDIAADSTVLGRWYFPNASYETFDEATKITIIADIEKDMIEAKKGLDMLPENSRRAVQLSYTYYQALLEKIKHTPAHTLLEKRIRIRNVHKARLLTKHVLTPKRKSSHA